MSIDPTVVSDVVVVVPGIMGSELIDAAGRPVWSVSAGGLVRAIRTLGASLRSLELPRGIGDAAADDGVRASGLIRSLHVVPGLWSPVTGYDQLMDFLRSSRFHLVEASAGDARRVPSLIAFPYDWRLSNRHNGRLLARVALDALHRWRRQPGMSAAKLVLICHSMGGLVARWFAEQEGGAEFIRTMITIGTPHRGALNALATLANGLAPGFGPLRLPLTSFVRSLPALYQLLPQYDCIVAGDRRARLDAVACPGLDGAMLRDAIAFHDAIAGSEAPRYALHKVVGIRQSTPTTARITGGGVEASPEIDGRNQGGDGTVPRLSAEPVAGRGREVHEVADQHGELQANRALLDLVDGILSREEIVWQASPVDGFGLAMDDLWSTRDTVVVRVLDPGDRRFRVTLLDETRRPVAGPIPLAADGTASLGCLPEGGYRAVVSLARPGPAPSIARPFLVLDPDAGP